jgi:radical SAM protein with 4Fe4S-binding SPASM domain
MCYVHHPGAPNAQPDTQLTAADWLEIGEQAAQAGLLYLLLTGGEIFFRPDFWEIYAGFSALGLQMSLNTNATLITPRLADRLAQLPPRVIAVTLYGASAETYERVSGDAGAFDRTIRGVRLLLERNLNVRLRTTLIQQNQADLAGIYQLARSFGRDLRLVSYVYDSAADSQTDPYAVRLSPAQQSRCAAQLRDWLFPPSENNQHPSEDSDDVHLLDDLADANPASPPEGNAANAFLCSAGHDSYGVKADGRLVPCLLLDSPAIPWPEWDSFSLAWNQLRQLCDTVPACPDCAACALRAYCRACPAKLYSETGSFSQKAPYLCQMAELAAAQNKGG